MSGSWWEFALAYAAFLAAHMIPNRTRLKPWMAARFGPASFGIAYGLLSTLLLVWLIHAAGQAPFVPLWDPALWQRWVVYLVMPFAIALAVFGIGAPNPLSFGPLSFGGRAEGFDPAHPGIAGIVRHPLLWALFLWSFAHMLGNGDLAHVLLFGGFALFAALGQVMIDRRRQRELGMEEWVRLARATSRWPFAALLSRRWHSRLQLPVRRLLIFVAVWWGALLLHGPVIGVSPLP